MISTNVPKRGPSGYLIVVAVVALLLPLTGCTSPSGNGGDEQPVTINLATPSLEPRDNGSETVWDAELSLDKVSPPGSEVKWSSVSVLIKDWSGSVLLQDTPVSKDTGLYGSAVEVWYIDSTGGQSTADAGDKLLITGMADTCEGAQVEVYNRGKVAAKVSLPTDFP